MNVSVRFVVFLTMIIGVLASPLVTRAQDETQPTFVKGRFDVPANFLSRLYWVNRFENPHLSREP